MLSNFLKEQQQLVKPGVKAVRTTAVSLAGEPSARPIFPLLPRSSLQPLIFGLLYPFLVLFRIFFPIDSQIEFRFCFWESGNCGKSLLGDVGLTLGDSTSGPCSCF